MTEQQTLTLAEFLLARIGEDEAGPWEHHREESEYHSCPAVRDPRYSGDLDVGEEFCDCGMPHRRARMLAECEAKRRIIEYYGYVLVNPPVLRFLALPYADHPDYRREWRP